MQGEWCGVEIREHTLDVVEMTNQEQTADREITRECGVQTVAVLFERRSRCIERFSGPTQVTRCEGNLGLGHHASRARDDFFRSECASGTSQELFRAREIAKLCHRDATQR